MILCLHLMSPDSGRVEVDGFDSVRDAEVVRRRLGVLPDARGVYKRLTARENIAYFGKLHGMDAEDIARRTRELFPDACDYDNPAYWTGLRPLTPSNVPYIGKTRFSNLFLNTGHGTLGWTMGCGSGRAIADIISGRLPEVDFAFTGISRPRTVINPVTRPSHA